jgi:hypothetical protein
MRALIHLATRHRAESDFASAFRDEVDRMRSTSAGSILEINSMTRLDDDLFGPCAPYRGTIEIVGGDSLASDALPLVSGIGDRFADLVHRDLSTALVGIDKVFVEPERTPVRYQYLMRRNADFNHSRYLERYETIHSQFGLKTPGIRGYVQLHLDLDASKALAGAAGLGTWEVDSVSELYLESVETFLAALGSLENDGGAREDEEIFVDKARSYDFTSRVDWQS